MKLDICYYIVLASDIALGIIGGYLIATYGFVGLISIVIIVIIAAILQTIGFSKILKINLSKLQSSPSGEM